jgi:hypothetical protein
VETQTEESDQERTEQLWQLEEKQEDPAAESTT